MYTARQWDIFCRVIDNYGDIGVCWRLGADLAQRGEAVRLWTDAPELLDWMAPGATAGRWAGIQVLHWDLAGDTRRLSTLARADVWIEGFGCELPTEFLAHYLQPAPQLGRTEVPAWINVEYLTAEPYARRAHLLPSPVMHGPGKGCSKTFFYPGFQPDSGGLIREAGLLADVGRFDRAGWLANAAIPWAGEDLVSMFCYEPSALPLWLDTLVRGARPTRLLVTPGRAADAVRSAVAARGAAGLGALAIDYLPRLSQTGYDRLLWACDLNFVRGEDSVIRAIWAGKPFVWQIYPQDDDVHHAKLQAFLDELQAPDDWRAFHMAWNGMQAHAPLPVANLPAWSATVSTARSRLAEQTDLATRLMDLVARPTALRLGSGRTG